jgi:hypothetical protein
VVDGYAHINLISASAVICATVTLAGFFWSWTVAFYTRSIFVLLISIANLIAFVLLFGISIPLVMGMDTPGLVAKNHVFGIVMLISTEVSVLGIISMLIHSMKNKT